MKEKVVKFFNEQASDYKNKYEKINDLRSFIFFERKRLVLDMLGKDCKRALDVGCGPGVYADELVESCDELYGIDISSEMIEIANNKHYSKAKFSVGSIENLQFKDNFFDSVICVGVLEYLDDIEKGIKETARVIKKMAPRYLPRPTLPVF